MIVVLFNRTISYLNFRAALIKTVIEGAELNVTLSLTVGHMITFSF